MDIFFKKKANTLSIYRLYNYRINLKNSYQSFLAIIYRISRDKIEKLRWYLNENLVEEFIYLNRSYAALPILFVKKLENKLQICIDYWSLNIVIIKNLYLLLLIQETLNYFCYAKIYTKLNIIAAFNCLHIQKKDKQLIVFCIRFGLFEYVVIAF